MLLKKEIETTSKCRRPTRSETKLHASYITFLQISSSAILSTTNACSVSYDNCMKENSSTVISLTSIIPGNVVEMLEV